MNKFRMIYNIVIDTWNVVQKYKDKQINDEMCKSMLEEFNASSSRYQDSEHKLAVVIADAIIKYLFLED